MPYAELKNNILRARDQREEQLHKLLQRFSGMTVIQLSLNIPGPVKQVPGSLSLHDWGKGRLMRRVAAIDLVYTAIDVLGPVAFYTTRLAAPEAKRLCCEIEESHPFARLLDCDVYDAHGNACDRAGLGLPQRRCLVCDEAARDCMRVKRHSPEEIKEALEELLKPFTAAGID